MDKHSEVRRFLKAIFREHERHAVFADAEYDPTIKKLGKLRHTHDVRQLGDTRDCYWSIAAFPPDAPTNHGDYALDTRALVIDDVGTKGPSEGAVELALGRPTTIVRTSPGNYQWGYRLSKPVALSDWAGFFGGIEILIGHAVPLEARAAQTLMRLPIGVNTKPQNNGFKVALVEVNEAVELDPDTITRAHVKITEASREAPKHIHNIKAMVALLPNDIEYDEWIAIGQRIKALAVDEEDGREAWLEFSSRTTLKVYDEAYAETRWRSFTADRTGGGLLIDAVQKLGGKAVDDWWQSEATFCFPDDVDNDMARDAARAALAARVAGTVAFTLDQQRSARAVLAVLGGTVRKVGKDNWRQFDPASGRWLAQPGNHMLRLVEDALERRRAVGPLAGAGVNKKSYLSAVAELAAVHSSVIGRETDFDADPLLLGVPSGVIDLRAGAVRSARAGGPGDMVSRAMRCDPAPVGTVGPIWARFLGEFTQDDRALEEWLQIFAGYCLTGLRENHVMPFIYGSGTNGKSVFVNALRSVWGEYGKPVDHRLLFEKAGGYHLAPLAALSGARLATVMDVPQGAVWDMHLVKMLVSDDPIEANRMHQDPIVFELQAKFVVSGNHQPTVKDMDEGVRRRLRLLPMTREISEAAIDLQLGAKLRAEYPAIFRWALDGLDKYWRRGKLGTCSAITDATEEYNTMLDPFGRWVKTLVPDSGKGVLPNDLYRAWDAFKSEESLHGMMPNSPATLVKKMKEKKFNFSLTEGRQYLRGYKLGPSASTVF